MTNYQAQKAISYLARIASFNGHNDVYDWATDPQTSELMESIRTLLREIARTEKMELWTDYEKRFQVLIIGELFQLFDMAEERSLGEYETEEEAHEARLEAIEQDEQEEKYLNQSGR